MIPHGMRQILAKIYIGATSRINDPRHSKTKRVSCAWLEIMRSKSTKFVHQDFIAEISKIFANFNSYIEFLSESGSLTIMK